MTAATPFWGADGKSGDVAMMRLGQATHAFRNERHQGRNFVAIDLPFADERFSLVVVTTTDWPAPAKEFAPVVGWLAGAGFKLRSVDLALPRFSAAGREDLMPALDALGLDKARHAATALQGFAPGAMLSQVVQRAIIEVDEEGVEAGAATAAVASRRVIPRLLKLGERYQTGIVEVVSHTDGVAVSQRLRVGANLDRQLRRYDKLSIGDSLKPYDNVGLGMSRAVSVALALRQWGLSGKFEIEVLSAANLISPLDRVEPAKADDFTRKICPCSERQMQGSVQAESQPLYLL